MSYQELLAQKVETGDITASAADNIQTWLTGQKYAEYKDEIIKLIENEEWQTLNDNFWQVVPFGTGGRRGTVGVGSNRINRVTLGESAQGLANYLLETNKQAQEQGIVIAFDTRLTSDEFSKFVASVFAANDFKVYLFDNFRPTPELSFAVRHLQTAAGVVVSASHNPPSDNGFKAYWLDGGQVVPPHDANIIAAGEAVDEIKSVDFETAVTDGRVQIIGEEIDQAYQAAVLNESLSPARSAHVVYSPLHGTGVQNVKTVLEQAGFEISIVAEQATPDGNFPTVPNNVANPEMPEASDILIAHAQQENADIGITTDPDADRLGVVVRTKGGAYERLNGNQIATLAGYHTLAQLKQKGEITPKHFVAKTIVTTDFLSALAKNFGVSTYDNLLVGFKFIGELINLQQDNGDKTFVFGGEESFGALKGSYARDKDAAVTALMIAELASQLKDEGLTLMDKLNDLYRAHGLFWETLDVVFYEGAAGGAKMNRIMEELRKHPPKELVGQTVVSVVDRSTGAIINPVSGEQIGTNEGTKGDVFVINLSEDTRTRVTVRPSGTEPKLKLYAQTHQAVADDISNEQLAEIKVQADTHAKELSQAIIAYTESLTT